MGRPALDLDGQKFGMLMATNRLRTNAHGHERERFCYCDCGNTSWVKTSYLIYGYTKSCGCYRNTFRTLTPGQAARNQVWRDYTSNAQSRGLSWRLSRKTFDVLTSSKCFYCHRLPATTRRARRKTDDDFVYNGIDRTNNNLGYTMQNTVPCCAVCNRAKKDMSFLDFKQWIKDVINANS